MAKDKEVGVRKLTPTYGTRNHRKVNAKLKPQNL
jgi:hypothetical protein